MGLIEKILPRTKFLEWTGSLTGMAGTALLSLNLSTTSPLHTFYLYAVSNVCWIWFALRLRDGGNAGNGLLVMNAAYAIFTLNGLYNYS